MERILLLVLIFILYENNLKIHRPNRARTLDTAPRTRRAPLNWSGGPSPNGLVCDKSQNTGLGAFGTWTSTMQVYDN
eukprot:SAG31_NODE_5245_length_2652_cov_2.870008_4_plen_77_part_00